MADQTGGSKPAQNAGDLLGGPDPEGRREWSSWVGQTGLSMKMSWCGQDRGGEDELVGRIEGGEDELGRRIPGGAERMSWPGPGQA